MDVRGYIKGFRWPVAVIVMVLLLRMAALSAPGGWGFDVSSLDRSAKPCVDFYQFGNGGWVATHPIPASYPRWSRATELVEKNYLVLRQILEKAEQSPSPPGSNLQKIGDFYRSGMDEAAIEAAGARPLQAEMQRIAAVGDMPSLAAELARLHGVGAAAFFHFDSTPDEKDSTQIIAEAEQGGLGLPDRDYYTRGDAHSKEQRDQYVRHVQRMFELSGESSDRSAAAAQTVLRVETDLASACLTRVQLRDPVATYHRLPLQDLQAMTPAFPWERYLRGIDLAAPSTLNVAEPDFFKHLNESLAHTPWADVQVYLRWHLLHATAKALSQPFVNEDFHFYSTVLTGVPEMQPRWKRVLQACDHALGEALGREYVKVAFPPRAKQRALDMVAHLEEALREDIATLPWMSQATRREALIKLGKFTAKIGYPDKWRDYSALRVDRGLFVDNVMRANAFAFHRELQKIGKPVDRTEWHMSPFTVNAYYNPSMNEIVFPAGILQPPFFDPNADDAVNYGGMGAVIGHEMTHGFDDKGSQFDGNGNLRNWWTAEDLEKFKARAACVEQEFDGFFIEPGVHFNGKLVEGEAIADLGGLVLAYRAYQKSQLGKPHPLLDGFTPEQRFFLGFAQIWASSSRPEYARMMVNVDPHPAPRWRVNGTVANMAEFAAAFGCKSGEGLLRSTETQCRIW